RRRSPQRPYPARTTPCLRVPSHRGASPHSRRHLARANARSVRIPRSRKEATPRGFRTRSPYARTSGARRSVGAPPWRALPSPSVYLLDMDALPTLTSTSQEIGNLLFVIRRATFELRQRVADL